MQVLANVEDSSPAVLIQTIFRGVNHPKISLGHFGGELGPVIIRTGRCFRSGRGCVRSARTSSRSARDPGRQDVAHLPGPNLAGRRPHLGSPQPTCEQSVHYILVAAFLRGVTNSPPQPGSPKRKHGTGRCGRKVSFSPFQKAHSCFYFSWLPKPAEISARCAQRFWEHPGHSTPGAFVRASQDLNRASLARSRLDGYLTPVRRRYPASCWSRDTAS